MSGSTIGIRLADHDVERIDRRIKEGYYTSRSDFIRASVREKIRELDEREGHASLLRDMARERGITDEDVIKAARKVRKEMYAREFPDD